ncbi:hypothetical protein G4B88_021050 [Cannabis sativa]|uniref:Reverse transcriptase zinc-binding domain-containing protein n=1 Tax=Cannabis sativa TaxID=3483 RepID=A0A7J6HXE9_CANSA|nr:hypothetical protein G4B88_021050 [Cannabis sativa]
MAKKKRATRKPVVTGSKLVTAVVEVQKGKGDQIDKAQKGDEEKTKAAGVAMMPQMEKENDWITPKRTGGKPSILHSGYKETVIAKWNTNLGSLSDIVKNLLRVKHVLKKFNKEVVGDIVADYNLAKHEFCKAQEALAYQPTDRRHRTNEQSLQQAVKKGKFRAKLFYSNLLTVPRVDYARNVWHRLIMPKHRFIYWQVCNNNLLTRDNLRKLMNIDSSLCPVCENEIETHNHLFVDCLYTRRLAAATNS